MPSFWIQYTRAGIGREFEVIIPNCDNWDDAITRLVEMLGKRGILVADILDYEMRV